MESFIHTHYGYCYYTLEPEPLIYNLFVEPEYRRQGKSRFLIMMAMYEIRLLCKKSNIKIQAMPQNCDIPTRKLEEYYRSFGLDVI